MYQLSITGEELENILIKNEEDLHWCDVYEDTISVAVAFTIADGSEIKFKSPVNCSQITKLVVKCPNEGKDYDFEFVDAHGNDIGGIDNVFDEGAIIKAILDVTNSKAFVQNADTNTYLEGRLAEIQEDITAQEEALSALDAAKAPAGYGLGTNATLLSDINADMPTGFYYTTSSTENLSDVTPLAWNTVVYVRSSSSDSTQLIIPMTNSGEAILRHRTNKGSWVARTFVTANMFSYDSSTKTLNINM